MEIETKVFAPDGGPVVRLDLVANGTRITVAEGIAHAVHIWIVGADGSRIAQLTIRDGPSGSEAG